MAQLITSTSENFKRICFACLDFGRCGWNGPSLSEGTLSRCSHIPLRWFFFLFFLPFFLNFLLLLLLLSLFGCNKNLWVFYFSFLLRTSRKERVSLRNTLLPSWDGAGVQLLWGELTDEDPSTGAWLHIHPPLRVPLFPRASWKGKPLSVKTTARSLGRTIDFD